MTAIIITDEVKLRALIQEEVSRAMPKSSSLKDEIDSITLEVAVSFLAENGYPISKAKMYKLTSANTIPYQKFGQKLVFSRKSLLAWAEANTKPKHDSLAISLALARSAKRKR